MSRPSIEEAVVVDGAATWIDAFLRFEVTGLAPEGTGGAPSHRLRIGDHMGNEFVVEFTPEEDGRRVVVIEGLRFATSARALTPAATDF